MHLALSVLCQPDVRTLLEIEISPVETAVILHGSRRVRSSQPPTEMPGPHPSPCHFDCEPLGANRSAERSVVQTRTPCPREWILRRTQGADPCSSNKALLVQHRADRLHHRFALSIQHVNLTQLRDALFRLVSFRCHFNVLLRLISHTSRRITLQGQTSRIP